MFELTKTQYLFIQSKNRARGNPWDFEITFPDGVLECSKDEVMAFTLMSFALPYTWYMVNDTNNTFTFTDLGSNWSKTVTLNQGNYPYRKLADAINEEYSGVFCEYLSPQNKLQFTFNTPHSITFAGKSYQVLGFNSNETPQGSTITSTNQLQQGIQITEICLSLMGLAPYRDAFNIDTIGNSIQISNVLLAMPFSVNPFEIMTFKNLNNQNTMFVNNKKVNTIRFTITDFDDNFLTFVPDFSMTIRVESFAIDTNGEKMVQQMDRLLDLNKLQLMQGRQRYQNV
jgi:hypothetical protein